VNRFRKCNKKSLTGKAKRNITGKDLVKKWLKEEKGMEEEAGYMEQMYRLGEIEEVLAELDLEEIPDVLMEREEEYQIVISGWWIEIPELGLCLYEGTFCNFDKEEQIYLPDFSITVIKEIGADAWLYYEQDGFFITLANWLYGSVNLEQLEQMSCFIRKSEEVFS
jgi:hypothetical protein